MVKRIFVADTPDTSNTAIPRTEARIAFDTAHGKTSGMISNAAAGHPTNIDTARGHLDTTLAAYNTMSQEERQSLYPQISGLLAEAAAHNIKPSSKPRVAAPAVQARANDLT